MGKNMKLDKFEIVINQTRTLAETHTYTYNPILSDDSSDPYRIAGNVVDGVCGWYAYRLLYNKYK